MVKNSALYTLLATLVLISQAEAFDLGGTIFADGADQAGIDPYLLYSVALVESGTAKQHGGEMFGPWPWTVRISRGPKSLHGGHRFKSKEEATDFVASYIKGGYPLRGIDLGMMQINIGFHSELVAKHGGVEAAMEPATNIKLAAHVLSTAINSTTDPIIGVGRYFSWRNQMAVDYGKRVYEYYEKLSRLRLATNSTSARIDTSGNNN